jgi:glycosyltransferase involved in cell wall biosynthesis
MSVKKSILLVGPFPKPVTGLSLANEILYKGLSYHSKVDFIDMSYFKFEEDVGKFNFYKMMYFFILNLKAFNIYNYDSVYITIGQSFFGVLKYALFFITGKIFRKRIVIHLHGNQLGKMYENQSFFKKKLLKSILSLASSGIVISSSLRKNLFFFLRPEEIFVVDNFVENELFLLPNEEVKKDYSSLKIAYIGNLMTEKGVFYLLDALVSLKKQKILFKAKFAGNIDKVVYNKIMRYFDENENFEYLGIVRNKEKKELLLWANTFVFPSYLVEGLPLSILEAIITRNAIITTEHPALNDTFTKNNFYFIEKKSSENIVNALKEQVASFDENRINNNYNKVKGFTEMRFVSKIQQILNL